MKYLVEINYGRDSGAELVVDEVMDIFNGQTLYKVNSKGYTQTELYTLESKEAARGAERALVSRLGSPKLGGLPYVEIKVWPWGLWNLWRAMWRSDARTTGH